MELELLKSSDARARPGLREEISAFLYNHLEQYGDAKDAIEKCYDYAMSRGGFALTARENGQVVGAVIVNETGMGGYIPENILVYIAVDRAQRGKGVGKKLMQKALAECRGDVALHVEPDNPARKLYESLGFTNKYLEMRYHK